MTLFYFIELMRRINKRLGGSMGKVEPIQEVRFPFNPLNPVWGHRGLGLIDKVIVHQELGNGDAHAVYKYHVSVDSHLKLGVGAPNIAYHYVIESNGEIKHVNDDTAVVWHTRGQNLRGVGIMMVGNFAHSENVNGKSPTKEQLKSLRQLLGYITDKYKLKKSDVYGHKHFGKDSCPGFVLYDFIEEYRTEGSSRK